MTALQTAAQAYLTQLEETHKAREQADGERERADRAAQIEYMKAHVDALSAA